jgi:hypothetical protein
MKTQTILKAQTAASIFFHDAQNTFEHLWARWQDEKEYEDIADYADPLAKIATPLGVSIVKMHRSPFGCQFKTTDGNYIVKVTSREYSYKKVAA